MPYHEDTQIEVTANTKCCNCESAIEKGEPATQLEDIAKGVAGGILCKKCRKVTKKVAPKPETPLDPAAPPPAP